MQIATCYAAVLAAASYICGIGVTPEEEHSEPMVESIAATAGGGGSAPAANEPARERGVSDSRVSASGSGSGSGPAWHGLQLQRGFRL